MFCIENEIQTTKAWSFLGVSKETVERYFQLFQDSYTPSKARLVYIAELKEKLGEEEFFKISLKRSINPPSGTVFHLFTKYSEKFGSANGPDSFVKSSEEIEKFNAWAGEKIFVSLATISFLSILFSGFSQTESANAESDK